MGDVYISYRVMPTSVDTDLDKIQEDIKENVGGLVKKINAFEIKPIAFGLKAIIVSFIVDDKEGGVDEIETALTNIPDVENIEVDTMTLL